MDVAGPLAESVVDRLSAAGCVAADEEAHELLAAAPDDDTLEAWLRRREEGEPLAWIIGTTRFCGHTVGVDRGVYVPRRQTEELAERAVALLPSDGAAIDLCTGSGAIAVHLMTRVPTATVVALDVDVRAARCARRNGVAVVVGHLDQPLRPKVFDVVTAVAPYVPTAVLPLLAADVQRYEPRLALDGGHDGLDSIRRIVRGAARVLRPGGWLLIEVGAGHDVALRPVLAECGFQSAIVWFDDDGDVRGLAARACRLTCGMRGSEVTHSHPPG